jgi:hypothetical protein
MESFRECGLPAFLSLGLGILATLVGAVALSLALLKPRTGFIVGVLALATSLGAPGAGVIGMVWGRHQTDTILASGVVDPDQQERLRQAGYAEAGQCVPIGATFGVLPLMMAGIAIAVAVVKQKGEAKT